MREEPPPDEQSADHARGRREYLRKFAWAFWRNVLVRDFADHAPVNYVAALRSTEESGSGQG